MSTQGDRYIMLTDYVISLGAIQHSVIVTGWGQEDGHRKTMLRVEMGLPKNTFTDAQVMTIAQQIQTLLGTPLHSVEHSNIDALFP